ncbi:MAG: hypothetical protein AB8B55_06975 [Mariniblastus sp.]
MKSYPSTKRYRDDRYLGFTGHTFAKLDGSNLRFEWDTKRGWYRFGSRRRLVDESHSEFGIASEMFQSKLAGSFERMAVEKGWPGMVVYCEFWGEKSFAGEHMVDDDKFLTPIDVAVQKKGLLSADEFVRNFEDQFDLHYLGVKVWDEAFVEAVKNSTLPKMAFEGVIGKNGTGHQRLAIKLKSEAWIDKVMSKYGEERGRKIVDS